jgi:hypothetical protein
MGTTVQEMLYAMVLDLDERSRLAVPGRFVDDVKVDLGRISLGIPVVNVSVAYGAGLRVRTGGVVSGVEVFGRLDGVGSWVSELHIVWVGGLDMGVHVPV